MRLVTATGVLLACLATAAEPVRLLVSLGSNYGRPEEVVLQHAEDDATRVRELFVELGNVEASRAVVLERPSATQVREKFAEVTGRVAELEASGRPVQLFVFATSHGRDGVLHLAGSELPVAELRELARKTGAALRVVIVDACEAGVRQKGARRGPAYELSVKKPEVEGDVFLSSSGAHEAAQEWDALQGSLFTHHLLAALRGDADADGDGRVSLMEAYGYAERRTVSESVDVGQHPQFDVGVTGHGELVLTEPARARAKVTFDESLEGRFVVTSQPRPAVVIEVAKQRGRPLSLAVPPGRYLVRQTRGFSVALQELELPFGGAVAVDAKRFVTRDYGEVALKGGELEFHPHALLVGVGLDAPPLVGTPLRWNVGLGYRLSLGVWWGLASVGWGTTAYSGQQLSISEHRVVGRLAAGTRFWLGPLVVMVGGLSELSVLRQTFVRDREVEIAKSYGPLPPRLGVGLAFGPLARVDVPLVGPLFVTVGLEAQVRWLPREDGAPWTVGGGGDLGLGVRL